MNPLHEMIKALPPRIEFLIVIMWAFGLPIFSSILSLGASDIDKREYFDNTALISVVVLELIQSLFLIWFLRIRGWTLEKLGLSVTLRGTVFGLGLLAVAYGVIFGVQALAVGLAARMQTSESFLYQERAIFDHLFDVAIYGQRLLRPRLLLVNALEAQSRRRKDVAAEYLGKLTLLQERHALPPGPGVDLVSQAVATLEQKIRG